MSIKYGTIDIDKIYLGDVEISKVYLGEATVFERQKDVVTVTFYSNDVWFKQYNTNLPAVVGYQYNGVKYFVTVTRGTNRFNLLPTEESTSLYPQIERYVYYGDTDGMEYMDINDIGATVLKITSTDDKNIGVYKY